MTTSSAVEFASGTHGPAEGSRPTRHARALGVLLAALLIASGSYVAGSLPRSNETPAPRANVPVPGDVPDVSSPADGLGARADGRLPIADRLAFWADRVAARPDDFLSLVQLALVEAEQARLAGDLDGYQRALNNIDRSLAIVPAYPPTIRARGAVRFALHDFSGALADARTVLAASPTDAAALALSGDAAIELGLLADAEASYDRLDSSAPGPWLDIRRARLASVTGDPARALSLARRALEAAGSTDPGEVAFYQFALGEYARLAGDSATARAGFEAVLAIRSSDIGALLGLARIEAFEGDVDESIRLLREVVAIAPQPESLALLGDALAANGATAEAAEAFETIRFIGRLGSVQSDVYDRQLLRFELDHGGASFAILEAARSSLEARPDASGHDLVAWALYRLGRYDEAAAEISAARASGADEARLRLHDGAITLARGDRARGLRLLEQALAMGPALDPIEQLEAEILMASL